MFVNHEPLRARALELGLLMAIVLLPVGVAVATPRAAAAQEPPEMSDDNLIPVPGARPQAARMRGQIPCERIISKVDQNLRPLKGRAANVESQKGREATVAMVARQLGTTQMWVAQCMRAYGRRVPANLENVQNEDMVEEFEDQEPEESASEDLTEPGARERNASMDENSQDRQTLRAENPDQPAQEKETVMHLQPENAEQ